MKSIHMTDEQAARYDNDDTSVMAELREQAETLHRQSGETVEVYHPDGFVVLVAQD